MASVADETVLEFVQAFASSTALLAKGLYLTSHMRRMMLFWNYDMIERLA